MAKMLLEVKEMSALLILFVRKALISFLYLKADVVNSSKEDWRNNADIN